MNTVDAQQVAARSADKLLPVVSPAIQFLVLTVSGWVTRHQLALVEYLVEENRVLPQHSVADD